MKKFIVLIMLLIFTVVTSVCEATYSRTNWVDGQAPPLSAANLNNIEQGIVDADEAALSGRYVVDATETDQGLTGNGKTVKAYVDSMGATKNGVLLFLHTGAGNTTTYTFSTSETITSNITCVINPGAILSIDSGKTLTINGPFECGLQQAFSGAGSVAFGTSVGRVVPQWWYSGSGSWHTAANAAIASMTSGDVWFLGGKSKSYSISSPIIPKSEVNLKGDGATIFLSNTSDDDMIDFTSSTTDVVIEGIEFDGNGSNQTRADTVNIIHATAQVKRLTINKCVLRNSSYNSVRLSTAFAHEDVVITENRFYDYDATAVQIYGTAGGTISNNIFDNTALAAMTAGGGAISLVAATDITISSNTVDMDSSALSASFGIEIGTGSDNSPVTGNTIQCNSGTFNGGISVSGAKNAAVSGNSIYQAGKVAAIEAAGTLDGCSITGNSVDGTANNVPSIGIYGNNANVVVSANSISNYSGVGISVVSSGGTAALMYAVGITGNTLIDQTEVGVTSYHGIYCSGAPGRSLTISGNAIHNNISAYGIQIEGTVSYPMVGHSIVGNVIYNCLCGLWFGSTYHTNHIVTGNVIEGCATAAHFTGSGHIIRNNTGWITENSGSDTIASGTTSKVVAHGLSVTPSAEDIRIIGKENPTNAVGTIWVDTVGATNFTVNVENDPGASNWDFGWSATVY